MRVRGVTVSVKQPTNEVLAEYAGRHDDDTTVAWRRRADERRKIQITECIVSIFLKQEQFKGGLISDFEYQNSSTAKLEFNKSSPE